MPSTVVSWLTQAEFWYPSLRVRNLSPGLEKVQEKRSVKCLVLGLYLSPRVIVNKWPQTDRFKTTEMYYFAVLEVKSLKSKCWQGHAPCKGSRQGSSLLLLVSSRMLAPGVPWFAAAEFQPLPPSPRGFLPWASFSAFQISFSFFL